MSKIDFMSDDEFENIPTEIVVKSQQLSGVVYDELEIAKLLDSPVITIDMMSNQAAIVYSYLIQKQKDEIENKGTITDHTRRIMESFYSLLEKLHKAKYGEKSINLHLNSDRLSPDQINRFINQNKTSK